MSLPPLNWFRTYWRLLEYFFYNNASVHPISMLVFWSHLCSWSVKLNLLPHLLFSWFKNARELILVRAINYYSTKRNYPITILPYGKRIQNYFNNLTWTYCSILTFLFALDVPTIICTQILHQTAVDADVFGGIPLLCSHKIIKIWNHLPSHLVRTCSILVTPPPPPPENTQIFTSNPVHLYQNHYPIAKSCCFIDS